MKKGFTLAELLIVIVLVGVLTLMALPKYRTAVERARALEAMEDVCMLNEYVEVHRELDSSFTLNMSAMADTMSKYDASSNKLIGRYFEITQSGGSVVAYRSDPAWHYRITSSGCVNNSSYDDCTRLDLPDMHCAVITTSS